MKESIIKYGSYSLITGLVIFTLHLVIGIDSFNYSTNEILGYISILITLSFIYFGIKHYRDKVNKGALSFGRAISIGVLISFLAGIGIAFADFIYTKYINPSFFTDFEQRLIDSGKEDQIIEMTSTTAALFMFVLVLLIGFIISLISGIVLRKN